jgi:hypothetical protein
MAPAFGGASFALQTPTVSLVFGVVEARFIAINPLVVLKLRSFRVGVPRPMNPLTEAVAWPAAMAAIAFGRRSRL